MRVKTSIALVIGLLLGAGSTRTSFADPLDSVSEAILKNPPAAEQQELFADLAVEGLVAGDPARATATVNRLFGKAFAKKRDRVLGTRDTAILAMAADAAILLAVAEPAVRDGRGLQRDVAEWLFGSDAAIREFLNTAGPRDNIPEVLRIARVLHDHDPDGHDEFRNLILAFAVVWDSPRRPLHGQIGSAMLPFEPELEARYDYYKALYSSKRAEIPYRRLSTVALTFVVDTPVPVSELQWVRENVAPRGWQGKFSEIRYDTPRLDAGQYVWPNGPYTLETIEEKGGICVDQAYYAVLAARGWGIPSLLFSGEGRRGPHAWFGYMKGTEKWELEVGRYVYDKYATGHATDPRTDQPMTDHYLEYLCDIALKYDRYDRAARLARLSRVLTSADAFPAAIGVAREALGALPLCEEAWDALEAVHRKQGDDDALLAMLDTKAGAFRRYDDFVAEIRLQQAEVLRRLGRESEAAAVVKRSIRRIDNDRDDLKRAVADDEIRQAREAGDPEAARKRMEDLLRDHRREGQKIVGLVEEYLDLTKETGQEKEAARFLDRFLDSLLSMYSGDERNERTVLNLQLRAYENAGDERKADRVRRKLDKLDGR